MRKEMISGFADEICDNFIEQLETLNELGIKYICLRAIDGKSIIKYTEEDAKSYISPTLEKYGIKVSSLGSPIGKIHIDDEDAYARQLNELETLCKIANILDCKYIRLFSFWMPKGEDPAKYRDIVINKMAKFIEICDKYGVVPMHENEKDIYGDTGARCKIIHDAFKNTSLRAAYDFANFVQCDEDTMECYELLKNYVEYLHIKDACYASKEVVLFGTGDGKVREILRLFKESGYDGFLTMEPHLRLFSSLASLEADDSTIQQLKASAFSDGKSAYTAQYHALCGVIDEL